MNPLPNRKQMRLKEYDYSQNGCYFVTICTKNRQPILWKSPSTNGLDAEYSNSVGADVPVRPEKPEKPEKPIDCMQNNVNGNTAYQLSEIGKIVDECWNNINKIYSNVKTDYYVIMPDHFHGLIIINDNVTGGQGRPPLQKIIQGFKSITTKLCFKYGFKQIWQRGYYDHIIRDEDDYIKSAEYVTQNPIYRECRLSAIAE